MQKLIFLFVIVVIPVFAADRPNVVVIMADDIGAEGLNCYGSTIYTTPHLDRMAAEGIRFNNAYATPLCTPTRVMIMSGLYPNRTGYRGLIGKGEGVRMAREIRTFGHDFKDAGYATGIAGKWQLGKFDKCPDQPVSHGFDKYCMWTWFYGGKKHSRFYKPKIYADGKIIDGGEKDFGPDYFRDFALNFIDDNKDKPFFLYLPLALVHSPFVHPPRLEELARTKYTDDLSKQTVAFGHMITYMDDVIGQLLVRLRKHGIDKNTLVIFTGDNGTHKAIVSKLPGMDLQGGKGTMTEAGSRVPFLAWWPGTIKPAVREEFFCLVDVIPTVTAMSGIKIDREIDGMDLSHNFLGKAGKDREHVLINHGGGFFVRDKRFRMNKDSKKNVDGTLYDIPVTSDKERYSENVSTNPEHEPHRRRLEKILDEFMAIEAETYPSLTAVKAAVKADKEKTKGEKKKKAKKKAE